MTNSIKSTITDLAAAASLAGMPAPTEKQVDFIVALMVRKNISVKLFAGQVLLTKQGASNTINDLKAINPGMI